MSCSRIVHSHGLLNHEHMAKYEHTVEKHFQQHGSKPQAENSENAERSSTERD